MWHREVFWGKSGGKYGVFCVICDIFGCGDVGIVSLVVDCVRVRCVFL